MISEMMSEVSVNVIERQAVFARLPTGTDSRCGAEKLNVGTIPNDATLRFCAYVIFCTKKVFLSNVLFGKMQKKPRNCRLFLHPTKKLEKRQKNFEKRVDKWGTIVYYITCRQTKRCADVAQ